MKIHAATILAATQIKKKILRYPTERCPNMPKRTFSVHFDFRFDTLKLNKKCKILLILNS
uniref:Uncharacterized protein n=1 Tax=Romanomermis culicivorax TaxID=13658 RepID=A0A915I2M5_ROMCU